MEEKINLQQIKTLNSITINLVNYLEILESNFKENINLYGLINYSRTHFFPQLSSCITGNEDYSDIFFNYTTAESMILDLFSVIESDLILILEDTIQYDDEKMTKMLTFSIKILKILCEILKTKYEKLNDDIAPEKYLKLNKEYTGKLFSLQNRFYILVYDEKIDSRIR